MIRYITSYIGDVLKVLCGLSPLDYYPAITRSYMINLLLSGLIATVKLIVLRHAWLRT